MELKKIVVVAILSLGFAVPAKVQAMSSNNDSVTIAVSDAVVGTLLGGRVPGVTVRDFFGNMIRTTPALATISDAVGTTIALNARSARIVVAASVTTARALWNCCRRGQKQAHAE